MNILGLHFGHDGGVAVIADGAVRSVILTERISRIKHATSLDTAIIALALRDAGLDASDIDYCAVTTTQTFPITVGKNAGLRITFGRGDDRVPSVVELNFRGKFEDLQVRSDLRDRRIAKFLKGHSIWSAGSADGTPEDLIVYWAPEVLPRQKEWAKIGSLASLAELDVAAALRVPLTRYTFHYPLTLELDGRRIPGAFVDHHAAHAADTFYQSGLSSAAILTFDGAPDVRLASLLHVGIGNTIVPIAHPHLGIGWYYNLVAESLGLNGDAGKLMGLAPYGKPAFFDSAFVGTGVDLGHGNAGDIAPRWLDLVKTRAARAGYDLAPLGDRDRILQQINVDIAASAHQTFEENTLAVVRAFERSLERSGVNVDGICLSGGCALSCPTNTRIAQESGFRSVFIEPSCDDSGLATGAALWAYHNLFDQPRTLTDPRYPVSPYQGRTFSSGDVMSALEKYRSQIVAESLGGGAAQQAAADLAADHVIGWYEGRSEIGPRALGHRSILADPRSAKNWPRVNDIKGREKWRPFAPAVLEREAGKWFKNMPLPSPYMLFTGDVIDPTALPAVTHVDGTSRIQTVTQHAGNFHDVLTAFHDLSSCPVVLNTSLNGPGEPIVESPDDALRFFTKSGLDVLYLEGHRITKAAAPDK